MMLYHVSEEPVIDIFYPRIPTRADLDQSVGLVWALDEAHLPNFLTPRNCPRVTYYADEHTTPADRSQYFSSPSLSHAVVIEQGWFAAMQKTTLYIYAFAPHDFVLQDKAAGYYVATKPQVPLCKYDVEDLFAALFSRHVELRVVDNLWPLCQAVKQSSLVWSMCRMGYAQPPAP